VGLVLDALTHRTTLSNFPANTVPNDQGFAWHTEKLFWVGKKVKKSCAYNRPSHPLKAQAFLSFFEVGTIQ
jgi:hypothetical protein